MATKFAGKARLVTKPANTTKADKAPKAEKAARKPRSEAPSKALEISEPKVQQPQQFANSRQAKNEANQELPAKDHQEISTGPDAHSRIDNIVLALRAHGIVIPGELVVQTSVGQPYTIAKHTPAARSASQAKKRAPGK